MTSHDERLAKIKRKLYWKIADLCGAFFLLSVAGAIWMTWLPELTTRQLSICVVVLFSYLFVVRHRP